MVKHNQIIRNTLKYTHLLFTLRTCLGLLERVVLIKKYTSVQPQLFILGLPRSGTTLVYQYIVHRLKVAYLTNGVGKYFLSPCIVTFLQHRLYGEYRSDFISNYGKVGGPLAPREAGSFWGRFFGFEEYIHYEEVKQKDIQMLRNTLTCVQRIFGDKPFVNKNVKHVLRIDALSKIFPSSIFLLVERDMQDVALSTLQGRYDNLKDPNKWWSVKPPNYLELINMPAVKQVAYQLISLKEKLAADLSKIPPDRILQVEYEQFCRNPEQLIERVDSMIGQVEFRNPTKQSFEPSNRTAQTSEERQLSKLIKNATSRIIF